MRWIVHTSEFWVRWKTSSSKGRTPIAGEEQKNFTGHLTKTWTPSHVPTNWHIQLQVTRLRAWTFFCILASVTVYACNKDVAYRNVPRTPSGVSTESVSWLLHPNLWWRSKWRVQTLQYCQWHDSQSQVVPTESVETPHRTTGSSPHVRRGISTDGLTCILSQYILANVVSLEPHLKMGKKHSILL
jgi:hypothetical protein